MIARTKLARAAALALLLFVSAGCAGGDARPGGPEPIQEAPPEE